MSDISDSSDDEYSHLGPRDSPDALSLTPEEREKRRLDDEESVDEPHSKKAARSRDRSGSTLNEGAEGQSAIADEPEEAGEEEEEEDTSALDKARELLRKFQVDNGERDILFTDFLTKYYGDVFAIMSTMLYCYSFLERGVVLRLIRSHSLPGYKQFHFVVGCTFCNEQQFKIVRRYKRFAIDWCVSTDPHECRKNKISAHMKKASFKPASKCTSKKLDAVLNDLEDEPGQISVYLTNAKFRFDINELYASLFKLFMTSKEYDDWPVEFRISEADSKIKDLCIDVVLQGLHYKRNYMRLYNNNTILEKHGCAPMDTYKVNMKQWLRRANESMDNVINCIDSKWSSKPAPPSSPASVMAAFKFLMSKCGDQFHLGAFNMTQSSDPFLQGNINLAGMSVDNSPLYEHPSSHTVPGSDTPIPGEEPWLSDENIGFVDDNYRLFLHDARENSLDDTLMEYTGQKVEAIPLVADEMGVLLKELSAYKGLVKRGSISEIPSNVMDTMFFCPAINNTMIMDKFVNVMFLERTSAQGYFPTLLSMLAISTENRVFNLGHMLYRGNTHKKHTRFFLDLMKQCLNIEWSKMRFMCDQSVTLEESISYAFNRPALVCTHGLAKNLHTLSGGTLGNEVYDMVHTLDINVHQQQQARVLQALGETTRVAAPVTYNRLKECIKDMSRCGRDDNFDIVTKHDIEPFQRLLGSLHRGNTVNLITQLAMIQLRSCLVLASENDIYSPVITKLGEDIISLNIALALTMKVKPGTPTSVRYDNGRKCSLIKPFEVYLRSMSRTDMYVDARVAYLDSLRTCKARRVTKTSCDLCAASTYYYYCPHILALRLHKKYRSLWEEAANLSYTSTKNYAQFFIEKLGVKDFIRDFGVHPVLYKGDESYCRDERFRVFFHPKSVNRWVSQVSR